MRTIIEKITGGKKMKLEKVDLAQASPERVQAFEKFSSYIRTNENFANNMPSNRLDVLEKLLLYGLNGRQIRSRSEGGTNINNGNSYTEVYSDVVKAFGVLTKEDRETLFEYLRFLRDPNSSNAEKEQLKLLLSGDPEMLSKRQGDFESQTLKDGIVFARCLKTQVDFTKIASDKDVTSAKLFEVALSASAETDKDRSVRKKLVEQAIFARRREILVQLEQLINRKEIDQAIELLQSLFRQEIKTEDDDKLVLSFAEALYSLELKNTEQQVINVLLNGGNLGEVSEILESVGKKVRPTVAGIVYIEEIKKIRERAEKLYKTTRFLRVEKIRKGFGQLRQTLDEINNYPVYSPQDISIQLLLVDEFEAYILKNQASIKGGEVEGIKIKIKKFRDEIEKQKVKGAFQPENRGQNIEGTKFVLDNFRIGAWNAFRALSSKEFSDETLTVAVWDEGGDMALRSKYRYSLEKLREQRRSVGEELSELETMYFRSVELMSKVNPYLVALAQEEPAITDEFLRAHFDRKSEETWANIKEGAFIPQVVVGMGPNGISYMGEMARTNPKLAQQTLVVDVADYPGGPFAIPGGNAFQLNSANAEREITLPDQEFASEKTLQGFQPGFGFPGERVEGVGRSDRPSINAPIGWGIRPDFSSQQRYPGNDEMVRTISLMSSVVLANPCTKTYAKDLKKISQSPIKLNGDQDVLYELTLVRKNKNGIVETKKIKTAITVAALGLGNRFYGYDLKGTQTNEILTGQANGLSRSMKDGGKYIDHTLDFLGEINNEREEQLVLPETIVLSGSGDSTAIALEKISGLFTGGAQNRKVKKVYIVGSQEDLSKRPRYSYIKDLLSRPGEEGGRLVEFIDLGKSGDKQNKLTDVRFATMKERAGLGLPSEYIDDGRGNDKNAKLVLMGPGNRAVTKDGKIILADKYVANTGFRNGASDFFSNLTNGATSRELYSKENGKFENITLPTNEGIVVGRRVKGEQAYTIGVSAELPFGEAFLESVNPNTASKITTLAVVNKVSIGVNAPASSATAQIINETNIFTLPEKNWNPRRDKILQSSSEEELFTPNQGLRFDLSNVIDESYDVSKKVSNPSKFLSTLIAVYLQDFLLSEKRKVTMSLLFNVNTSGELEVITEDYMRDENGEIVADGTPKDFLEYVGNRAAQDPYFARYIKSTIERRGNRKKYLGATAQLVFRDGKYVPQESALQI